MAGKPDMTSEQFRQSGLQLRGRESVDYKLELESQMRDEGLPTYEREFKFNDKRGWRFDYFFPSERVAVEYEGGIFAKGRGGHSSVSGILRDIDKYNEAALAGIIVIRVTAQTVANGEAVRLLFRAIERAKCAIVARDGRVVEDTKRTLQGLLKRLNAA